jgi:hypothetical protein
VAAALRESVPALFVVVALLTVVFPGSETGTWQAFVGARGRARPGRRRQDRDAILLRLSMFATLFLGAISRSSSRWAPCADAERGLLQPLLVGP